MVNPCQTRPTVTLAAMRNATMTPSAPACAPPWPRGELGSHHGLPVTVVVTTTLTELEERAGIAITGAGTRLPMRDLIRMARHAHHYLSIFDDDGRPLYLDRTKRIASSDQRLVLHARDRGCTHPDCTVPGYLCEVHQITEWVDGGDTDIDNPTSHKTDLVRP